MARFVEGLSRLFLFVSALPFKYFCAPSRWVRCKMPSPLRLGWPWFDRLWTVSAVWLIAHLDFKAASTAPPAVSGARSQLSITYTDTFQLGSAVAPDLAPHRLIRKTAPVSCLGS